MHRSSEAVEEQQTHQTQPRPFSLRRIFGWLSLAFILLVVGGHFLWGVLASHQLNVALTKLHARGEPILTTELNLGSVSDADNASLDYEAAGESIDTKTRQWKQYADSYAGYEPPLMSEELANVKLILSQNAVALQWVTTARGKQPGPWNDGDAYADISTMLLERLNPEGEICDLLKLAALEAHSSGDDEQAVLRLEDILAISDAGENRPSVLAHLVAVGASARSTETICKIASDFHIGQNGLKRQTVLQFMAQLKDETAIDSGSKLAWRSERIMGLNMARGMVSGTNSLGKGKAFGYLIKPFVLGDARLYAEHLQGVMLADGAPDYPAAQKMYPTQLPAAVTAHPTRHLFVGLLAPSYEKAVKVDFRARTQRRLAVVALAVRLYAADHADMLPASLDDLVPTYLPAIPIDGMSGKPLLFKANPPRVYSVGDDGVDDGGVPVDPNIPARLNPHGDVVVYLVTQPRKQKR